jgi:hypothetical protein
MKQYKESIAIGWNNLKARSYIKILGKLSDGNATCSGELYGWNNCIIDLQKLIW